MTFTATQVRPRHAVLAVCAHFDVRPDDVIGPKRTQRYSVPRQTAMAICREAGCTLSEIAREMKRDHTTVLHGIRAARQRQTGLEYKVAYAECRSMALEAAQKDKRALQARLLELEEDRIARLMAN